MSALPISVPAKLDRPSSNDGFLAIFPSVVRHVHFVFRRLSPADREEVEAEAVAAAFRSYVQLKEQGKDPTVFPTMLACFAALRVKQGRRLGGRRDTRDVLSYRAQKSRGFRVISLDAKEARLAEALRDDTRTPIPEQVAFRVDFPAWLNTMRARDRQMVLALASGDQATEVARRFKLSAGRVTQLRQEWQREWQIFHGQVPTA
jgi:hypothetical protein